MPNRSLDPRGHALACLALISLLVMVAPGLGQETEEPTDEVEGLADPRTTTHLKVTRQLPSQRLGVAETVVPEVRLPELDVEALLREDAEAAGGLLPMQQRIGVGRELALDAQSGNWWDLGERGRLWMAEVAASGAAGVRLKLGEVDLPAGAELALYAPAPGGEPGAAADEPLFVDPGGERELWTGTFFGERVRIEYFEPAGGAEDVLPFRVEQLQHLYRDPLARELTLLEKGAGPCHYDVSCFPDWSPVAAGTARITYTKDGDSYLCTGQLLNNKKTDFSPFFLTAKHCVDSQAVAHTVEFFWFYQTATCGGVPPQPHNVPRSRRASLIALAPSADGALLMAEGTLPGGLYFLGWNSGKIADNTHATGVHHPAGDYKRISFGGKVKAGECPSGGTQLGLGNKQLKMLWLDGTVEQGSSGSGIYTNAKQQLFGVLSLGPVDNACAPFACYGEFATQYKVAAIKKSLTKGGSDDNLEQNDTCKKAKLLKKPGGYGNRIVKVFDQDWYKMSVPPGRTVWIELDFAHANGDIDLAAYGSCGSEPFAASTGSSNQEVVGATNVGSKAATLFWRVWLADDMRNAYDMTVILE